MATNKNLETPLEKTITDEANAVSDAVVEPTSKKASEKKVAESVEEKLAKTIKSIFDDKPEIEMLIVCGDGESFQENSKPQAERWAKAKKLKLYEINSNLEVTLLTDNK